MRQARKRALSRRKPLQIGYGITFSVFLALMGLMLFERIITIFSVVTLGRSPAGAPFIFRYGGEGAMGPLDWMAVALAGLLFAQGFRAFQAWRRKEASWSGLACGACNIGMIMLFVSILTIYWAFYNPLSPGRAFGQ